jgi:dihydrofolate reductase
MFARFDVILMGRRTYETTRKYQGGSMPGIESYVFSRTLRQADCRGVVVSDNPSPTVSALRKQSGKEIWLFGGGVLFRSLLELGLVDRVSVAIIPVLRRRRAIAARLAKPSEAPAGRAPALCQDGHGVAGVWS